MDKEKFINFLKAKHEANESLIENFFYDSEEERSFLEGYSWALEELINSLELDEQFSDLLMKEREQE